MYLTVVVFLLLQFFAPVKLDVVPSSNFLEHVEIQGIKYNYSNFATGCQLSLPISVFTKTREVQFKFFTKESVKFNCAATAILRNKEQTCKKEFKSFFACTNSACTNGVNVFFDGGKKKNEQPSIHFEGLHMEVSFQCALENTEMVDSGCIVIDVNDAASPSADKNGQRTRRQANHPAFVNEVWRSKFYGKRPRFGFAETFGPVVPEVKAAVPSIPKKIQPPQKPAPRPEPVATYNQVKPATEYYCTCGNIIYYFTSN